MIPRDAVLTPRPAQIDAWDDYDDRYKPVAARLMEVYAGFLAHVDAQVGRLIDALEQLGRWDNTLFVYLSGDNGASGEGTVHGVWAAPAFQNGAPEDPEWLLAHLEDFGSARCENHYNAAWAWALDAPFQWMKQIASPFGGSRNGLAISWPAGIAAHGERRTQFHHVIDLAPTILDAAGVEEPNAVHGIQQKPIAGVSMVYSFDDADAPSTRVTQYFEVLGNRAIYHDGWVAACFHGRVPWIRSQAIPFGDSEQWELYRITEDFSQGRDLAAENPDKVVELHALFDVEAAKYGVFPLSDETVGRALPSNRPSYLDGRTHHVLYRDNVRMPELATVNVKNTSFVLRAYVDLPPSGASGVIICQGGAMAGWSLYIADGSITYLYNLYGRQITAITANLNGRAGAVEIGVRFDYDGGGLGNGGTAVRTVDSEEAARGRIERTVPFLFSMSGETLDVGIDTGSPVGPYVPQFPFTGGIDRIEIDIAPALDAEQRQHVVDGQHHAAMSIQ